MSLAEPSLTEAQKLEAIAKACVGIALLFVPGGSQAFTVITDALDVAQSEAEPIEAYLATILSVTSSMVGPDKLRTLIDAETVKLVNEAADLEEDAKFGPSS